jgi:hypothetical protein
MKINFKISKYFLCLVSPFLIYFAYNGSNGAGNLLTAWTLFGFLCAIFASLLYFLFYLSSLSAPTEDEKAKELQRKVKEGAAKFKKITIFTAIDFCCFLFFIWAGWWGLAIMQFFEIFILKLVGFIATIEE